VLKPVPTHSEHKAKKGERRMKRERRLGQLCQRRLRLNKRRKKKVKKKKKHQDTVKKKKTIKKKKKKKGVRREKQTKKPTEKESFCVPSADKVHEGPTNSGGKRGSEDGIKGELKWEPPVIGGKTC